MEPVVECRKLGKAFVLRTNRHVMLKDRVLAALRPHLRETREKFWAIKKITFAVEPGETFALVGPNGAGKTTLLRVIAGIYPPTKGMVTVRGSLAAVLAYGVGFNPELTGRENIYLNAALFGLTTKEIRQLEDSIIEYSELGSFIDVATKNYSAGMNLRLGFAIAFEVQPDVFLMDEGLGVGDEHFKNKCLRRLADLRAAGRTFLVATHNLRFVEEVCDRAALLIGGRIVAMGAPKDVVECYRERLDAQDVVPVAVTSDF